MPVALEELIRETESAADSPLHQLEAASRAAEAMSELSDSLLNHFVDKCRKNGHTWAEIGGHLGVTRQAAQKRYTFTLERFTPRARSALDRAKEVARAMHHSYVGTEHLLLAQFDIEGSVAALSLEAMGIERAQVQERLAARVEPVSTAVKGDIAYTPLARRSLAEALTVALELGHNYIGTEHMLLGLLRQEGLAREILLELGATLETAHSHVVTQLSRFVKGPASPAEGGPEG